MSIIIVTGGSGRFGLTLKKFKTKHKIYYPTKNQLNILSEKKIKNYINKKKPKFLIHLAGLSRPMKVHKKNIHKSIDLNIIGTANIVKVCSEKNIKLIYFSTNYVYEGNKGNYKETDPLLPANNYAWSKLGGETSVQLYNNSLILRLSMTEKPFVHKKAFANVKTSFLYHEDVVKILFKILNKKGVLNIGGKAQFIYNFAKKNNPDLKKLFLNDKSKHEIPIDSSMNLSKLKKALKKR
jgi:dTDP-4-dehydrorhamnose reductase|tara:strand:+ start:749 stop:1462 length:714 start_codon:yes stop_codon:yes gene_type:complete